MTKQAIDEQMISQDYDADILPTVIPAKAGIHISSWPDLRFRHDGSRIKSGMTTRVEGTHHG